MELARVNPRPEGAVVGFHHEPRLGACPGVGGQPPPQNIVQGNLEARTPLVGKLLEACSDVIIKRHGGAHGAIMTRNSFGVKVKERKRLPSIMLQPLPRVLDRGHGGIVLRLRDIAQGLELPAPPG